MNINIYMFNDHILFSNNLNDAANQLRNIQLQKLQEEKYKKRSIKLQEKINILENKLNYLKEEKLRINLAAMYAHNPDYGGGDRDFTGWTQSDHERYKQWWHSLTPSEQKQFRKQWEEDNLHMEWYPASGDYVTPGVIPRQFQNPDLPHVINPQPAFRPRG